MDPDEKHRSARQAYDDQIWGYAADSFKKAVEAGLDEEKATEILAAAVETAARQVSPKVKASFLKSSKRLLRDERQRSKYVQGLVRERWGKQLDDFVILRTACREATGDFGDDVRASANSERDHVFEVLERISALSLRIASEILHLLENGLPFAALARCRPLHELGVTAWIMSEYGRRPEYATLAERYLFHAEANDYDAVVRLANSPYVSDAEKPTPEYIAALKLRHDAMVRRFGRSFKIEWGWAVPLFKQPKECTLPGLERLAGASEMRSHYAESSNFVHGGAMAAALNVSEGEGLLHKVTDAHMGGFVPPLWYASGHLTSISVVFMASGRTEDSGPRDLIMVEVLRQLFEDFRADLATIVNGE